MTNGVTPRRFVKLANPRLSDLITEGLGTDKWLSDLEMLKGLEPLAKDDEFVKKFAAVKKANKHAFVASPRTTTASISTRTPCSTPWLSACTSTSARP